jgi:hypothetical protein
MKKDSSPLLPIEVLELIFHSCASTSRPGAHVLTLVCRWTHDLASPYLYQTLVLAGMPHDDVETAKQTLKAITHDSNVATLIHSFWFNQTGFTARNRTARGWSVQAKHFFRDVISTIAHLPNLRHLALRDTDLYDLAGMRQMWEGDDLEVSLLTGTRITMRYVPSAITLELDPASTAQEVLSPLFSRITHLRLLHNSTDRMHELDHIPHLTHLALVMPGVEDSDEEDLMAFITRFTGQLRALVFVPARNEEIVKKRVLKIRETPEMDFVLYHNDQEWARSGKWEHEMRYGLDPELGIHPSTAGKKTMWDRALEMTKMLVSESDLPS